MVAVDKKPGRVFIDLSRQLGCEMSGTIGDAHSPWNASRFPRCWEAKADALEAVHSRGHLRQEVLPGGVVPNPAAVQWKCTAGDMTETFLYS